MSDPTGPGEDTPLGDPAPASPPTTPSPEYEPGQTPTEFSQPDRPYDATPSLA